MPKCNGGTAYGSSQFGVDSWIPTWASATRATTSGGRRGTGMWADSRATTMSIVICAGVPRAPLVDSHHLPWTRSRGESELAGKRVVLPPPSRTIHNARGESPGARYRRSSLDFASPRHLHYDLNHFFSRALYFSGMNVSSCANLLITNNTIEREIITISDRREKINSIR